MRSTLPRSLLLGGLELIEVYEYYDAPRLFSCRSITDQIYLAVWLDEDQSAETWLYAPISRRRFEFVRSGGIDLHAAFKESETGSVLRVTVPRMDGISSVVSIECDQLTEDMLPLPGEALDLETRTLPEFDRSSLRRVAIQSKREAIVLGLDFPGMVRTEAPVRTTNPIVESFQETLDAVGQAVSGRPTAKGKIPQHILVQTELALAGTGGGSFTLQLFATASRPLFGDSLLTLSLSKLMEVIRLEGNSAELKEHLLPMRARVASRYRIFLESLVAAKSSLKLEWASPSRQQGGLIHLSYQQLVPMLAAVTEVESDTSDRITVSARLIAANLPAKTFGLRAIAENEKYSGKILSSAMAAVSHATMNKLYKASLIEIREISAATGDEKIKYLMCDLEPIGSPG